MSKPDGYPLPWNDAHGEPYWRTNMRLCDTRPGWRQWQAGKPMAEIIAAIERGPHDA